MMDKKFEAAVNDFREIYRKSLNIITSLEEERNRVIPDSPEDDSDEGSVDLNRLFSLFKTAKNVGGEWHERASLGNPFSTQSLDWDVTKLTPKIAVVSFSENSSQSSPEERVAIQDINCLSMFNTLHCAVTRWKTMENDERERLTEIMVGVICAKMKKRSHRTLENVTFGVLNTMDYYSKKGFRGETHVTYSAQEMRELEKQLAPPLVVQTRRFCPGFVDVVLGQVDKAGKRALLIEGKEQQFYEGQEEEGQEKQLESQPDLAIDSDPLEVFTTNERYKELMRKFPEGQQRALRAAMKTGDRIEAARL